MIKTLSSEHIYKARIFDIVRDTIREGDSEYQREVIVHKGSAVIVPVFEDKSVVLVHQYRHPADKHLLEIPAGGLEEGEDPQTGAARELEEEIGVTAARIEKLAEFYVSPGFLTEKMYLFLATELTETAQKLDEDEFIELKRMPLPEALDLIRAGGIEDAKTIIGLIMAGSRLGFAFSG